MTYYERNKALILERAKKWHAEHRDQAIERMRAKRAADKMAGKVNSYYLANKEKVIERVRIRRAALKQEQSD